MKQSILILLSTLVLASPALPAVTIVECEDSSGERTLRDVCPPGTTRVDRRELRVGSSQSRPSSTTGNGQSISATLYMVPDCGPCLDIQEYLQDRNIPITAKDASGDIEVQNEIRELIGDLQVPVVVIGEKTLTGYSRSELGEALAAAGYSEDEGE